MSKLECWPQPLPLNNPFWRYSLSVYAHQPLQRELLWLQDDHGANVNTLLLQAWLSSQHRSLTSEQWQALQLAIEPLVLITQQIRGHRQRLKAFSRETQGARVYQQAKRLELVCEQYQQALCYSFCQANTEPAMIAEQGLFPGLNSQQSAQLWVTINTAEAACG